jgi:hypothetical protein
VAGVTEPWTETVDSADETVDDIGDEFSDEIIEGVNETIPEDAGIPDEPEPFVEEIRAQADLPETGDARVDEVLSGLAGIENLPTTEHVAVYDEVHRGLQDALANLDQG